MNNIDKFNKLIMNICPENLYFSDLDYKVFYYENFYKELTAECILGISGISVIDNPVPEDLKEAKQDKNSGPECRVNLFNDFDFIKYTYRSLVNYFDSKRISDIYIYKYLTKCLENTYDKVSRNIINHYGANVFVDCISTSINRYIIKTNNIIPICEKAQKYLVNNKFKNKKMLITHILESDNPSDNFKIPIKCIFDIKWLKESCNHKLENLIYMCLVFYLLNTACNYLKLEVNEYAEMIISDVAKFYNGASNVFFETLNKIKSTISSPNFIKIFGDSKYRYDLVLTYLDMNILDTNFSNDEEFVKIIKKHVDDKYSKWYSVISIMQSIIRNSDNKLASVTAPFIELSNILESISSLFIDIYKKLYYSFYDKYVKNGYSDKKLLEFFTTITNTFIYEQSKKYKSDKHDVYRNNAIFNDIINEQVLFKYTTSPSNFYTSFATSDELDKFLKDKIDFDKYNDSVDKDFKQKYASILDELRNDLTETSKDILSKMDIIIRLELVFKEYVNEWCKYIMKKAEDHIKFDVVDDCKQILLNEFSCFNSDIIINLFNYKKVLYDPKKYEIDEPKVENYLSMC